MPPERETFVVCPTETAGLVVLNIEDPLDPEELTVTFTVPQLLDWSQTVIVALPAATADIVSVLLDKLVETTFKFEFPDKLYVPLPPDTVTAWLPP